MFKPVYTCRRIDRDLELTGRLDDPLWQEAPAAELTDPIAGKLHAFGCQAYLLYNAEYLYVGFRCDEDYIKATYTAHDSSVWEEGCCEVFISPSGKMRQYYELNVSPINTVFDAFILNGSDPNSQHRRVMAFTDYTCKDLITRPHINGDVNVIGGAQGWTVEYAIPFLSVIGNDHLSPEPGDEWLLNLCHIASPKQKKDHVYYSWATVGFIDFHRPWTWGTLRFG